MDLNSISNDCVTDDWHDTGKILFPLFKNMVVAPKGPRVYFVGAHRTGKTTLARWVRDTYGLPMITEVARTVLAETEDSLTSLRTKLDQVASYQEEVFHRQINAEKLQNGGFVSDRAFDNLAYAAEFTEHSFGRMINSQELKEYMEWVGGGIVFFVRPDRKLLIADQINKNLDYDAVIRIDGMVKMLAKQFDIRYMPIHPVDFEERVSIMRFVLDPILGKTKLS